MCSRPPTAYWKPPNSAFVEVLLPDSATPIQPRSGASRMNHVPTRENPKASVLAIPEKLKTVASPKMIGATSRAPHVCEKLRLTAAPTCSTPTLNTARMTSRETRIQVPATAGANFHTTDTGWCESELTASTSGLMNV